MGPDLYTLYSIYWHWWRLLSFISNSIKCTQAHSVASFICLSSVLHLFEFPCTPCSSSQCSHAAGLWASNSTVSEPPLLFIRLSWSEARLCETSPAPGLPAALMALGRRHEQEDLNDLLSAAVTRCLQPESYQAQQSDKPPVQGQTLLRSRRRILKPATSNNSRTNLGIGELEKLRCWHSE